MVTNQTTSLATSANDIRDIKPPVNIPSGWEWLWWTLGALAVAALLFALWRWWQKRKANIPVVPPVPAHVRAKEMLEKALALKPGDVSAQTNLALAYEQTGAYAKAIV